MARCGTPNQGGLFPAGPALKRRVGAALQSVAPRFITAEAAETFLPARLFQGGPVLPRGVELTEEFRQRQTRLELDAIHGYDGGSLG